MRFIKFLGVGGTATALQYGLLILLVEANLAPAVIASGISYAVSSVLNYLLNYYFTFNSDAHHHRALLKFIAVACVGLSINTSLIYILIEQISIHYLIAQALATLTVLLWNYFAHKHWTYKAVQGN